MLNQRCPKHWWHLGRRISMRPQNVLNSAEEHVPTSPHISDLPQHRRRGEPGTWPAADATTTSATCSPVPPRVTACARRSERRVALAELATATQWDTDPEATVVIEGYSGRPVEVQADDC